jgi:hypothetical protein
VVVNLAAQAKVRHSLQHPHGLIDANFISFREGRFLPLGGMSLSLLK